MDVRILVVYSSSSEGALDVAEAVVGGLRCAGVTVLLRRQGDLTTDELAWADGCAFVTSASAGGVSQRVAQFVEASGGVPDRGALAGKPLVGFLASQESHGWPYDVAFHWGSSLLQRKHRGSASS